MSNVDSKYKRRAACCFFLYRHAAKPDGFRSTPDRRQSAAHYILGYTVSQGRQVFTTVADPNYTSVTDPNLSSTRGNNISSVIKENLTTVSGNNFNTISKL